MPKGIIFVLGHHARRTRSNHENYQQLSSPLRDCAVIHHARPAPVPLKAGYRAREGGRSGRWNYSMKLQLDSGFRRNDEIHKLALMPLMGED